MEVISELAIQSVSVLNYQSLITQEASEYLPLLYQGNAYNWMIYTLLGLLVGISVIIHFFPERIAALFSLSPRMNKAKIATSTFNAPGRIITLFFSINYFLTLGFFILIFIERTLLDFSIKTSDSLLMGIILAFVAGFTIYRIIAIRLVGLLFNTQFMARQQLRLFVNTDNALGVILIPLLMVLVYNSSQFLLVVVAVLILVFYLIKWFQTISIGISDTNFSVFHLILYLCTLEIIPLVILFRAIEKGGI